MYPAKPTSVTGIHYQFFQRYRAGVGTVTGQDQANTCIPASQSQILPPMSTFEKIRKLIQMNLEVEK